MDSLSQEEGAGQTMNDFLSNDWIAMILGKYSFAIAAVPAVVAMLL
jgi:hypothetical protein